MSPLNYSFRWQPSSVAEPANTADITPLEANGSGHFSGNTTSPVGVGDSRSHLGIIASSEGEEVCNAIFIEAARSLFQSSRQIRDADLTVSIENKENDYAY